MMIGGPAHLLYLYLYLYKILHLDTGNRDVSYRYQYACILAFLSIQYHRVGPSPKD
jgi:hypothetical protein